MNAESPSVEQQLEQQRIRQLNINMYWLIDNMDRIHKALCPGQIGTWQQRAQQAVEAAERLSSTTIAKPNEA